MTVSYVATYWARRMICIFCQNKEIISLKTISPQSLCEVLSESLMKPTQPRQC